MAGVLHQPRLSGQKLLGHQNEAYCKDNNFNNFLYRSKSGGKKMLFTLLFSDPVALRD
jgi:hypothetical protein